MVPLETFKSKPMFRTSEAVALGMSHRELYRLRDEGVLQQLSRGVFRYAKGNTLSEPDLVTLAMRVPKAVLCLEAALSFHNLTTVIPHEVVFALPRGIKKPTIQELPLRMHSLSMKKYSEGIETHLKDGATIKVYGIAKTVADCFCFRHQIGLELAISALKEAITKRGIAPKEILHCATIGRVDKVMLPYLRALTL